MSDKITFYTYPMSRGRIVHWMLEEVDAPYEIKVIDLSKQEQKSPAYLKINPMGKLPAIEHRGTVVTESAAICAYLADLFPQKQLSPGLDDPKRGAYLRWFFFSTNCFDVASMDKMLGRPASDKKGHIGYGSYEDTLKVLEDRLNKGPYILGDKFSAVDLYLASSMGYTLMMKGLDPRPTFTSYVERCMNRPAAKRMEEQCKQLDARLKK